MIRGRNYLDFMLPNMRKIKFLRQGYLKLKGVKRILRSDNLLNLVNSPNLYCADGFLTSNFVSFRNDAKFIDSFQKSLQGIPEKYYDRLKEIEWRAHIVNWAIHRAKTVKGDFIELGVWWGVLSKCVCEYHEIDSLERNFYLVDSWGKMPGSHKGYEEDIFEDVLNRFSCYRNVKLVRGVIPEVLNKILTTQVAYLGIDMNNSAAELMALEYFYEKMVPGGVIYIDDYGWNHPDLRDAIDNFFVNKPEKLLHFPSGNSIVIKI